MEKIELEANLRKIIGRSVKTIRNKGLIPGVVYGRGVDSIVVEVDKKALIKALSTEAGLNAIIFLKINEDAKSTSIPVMARDLQRDFITDVLLHIDFHRIIMEEEIKTKVPIVLSGESVGVKEGEGILVHSLREVEVKCLPTHIPDRFELDVSSLKIGDALHVSDLKAIQDITILSAPEEMIVTISTPTKEEVVAPPAEVAPAEVPTAEAVPTPTAAAEETKEKGREEKKPEEEKKK